MDKLELYRQLLKKILTDYYQWVAGASNSQDENCLIIDENRDHYLLLFLGWSHKKKTNNTHIYIRIKNQKIWIEEDWTEEGIANELLREGVPKEDIVLAFYPPEERKLTDFAIT